MDTRDHSTGATVTQAGQAPTGHRRGTLRIYLGAAPGVGKTFAMLNEGRRAHERGVDVVVGFVETHGRARTAEQVHGLEVLPRRRLTYRGSEFEEMDIDALLRRRPQRALVDELAHTNIPGSRNEKRWQDVHELLDAGIDVISTVNIQHLESLNDVVERITGIHQHETIPDEMVRAADQVELVDMAPEALRRRMAHGNVYGADKIDAALTNYFRPGNLAALRELALLWVADEVDVGLEDYRQRHGITEPWETRERVVVAVTGAPGTESLIRRAARMARRAHGELLGVHVVSDEGLVGPPTGLLDVHRKLVEEMGGEYREVAGTDIGSALVDVARAENATQIVLGASGRSRWAELTRGSVINRVIRLSGAIDVHVISQERPDHETPASETMQPTPTTELAATRVTSRLARRSAIPLRRQGAAWLLAVAGIPLLTLVLAQLRNSIGLPAVLLLFLALIVTVAAVGGTWPSMIAAVAAFLFANWYFTPPLYRWTIGETQNLVALIVFLGVALIVSRFVDAAARRASDAARAQRNATTLARLAASMGEDDPLPVLLGHLRSVFGLTAAALLHHTNDGWQMDAADGEPVSTNPNDADVTEQLAPGLVLALHGPRIAAQDHLVLNAFAAQLAAVVEHHRLRGEADRAQALAEANALRSALLQAVSHDLRTPLSSIKASVTSLCQPDVQWSATDTADFLRIIDDETDRLTRLVEQLLDMSRINAGALTPAVRPVTLEEVIPAALASLGSRAAIVDTHVSETLPPVLADHALLERVVANVVENALRVTPEGQRVRVQAGLHERSIELRIIDRGPGIPRHHRDQVFQPFQRLGDNQPGTGVGLGLAVARGFATAMDAALEIDDTPGGGTTMTITLPTAP